MEKEKLNKQLRIVTIVILLFWVGVLYYTNRMGNALIEKQSSFIDTLMADNQRQYNKFYTCRLQLFKCRLDSILLRDKIDSLENNKK